ncbi:MAG: hypothetical protein ACOZAN_03450 [Patescibacteria group bacterium]
MKRTIKIGFDFDGVIMYNPARLIRPIISQFKKKGLIKRKRLQFFRPKAGIQTFFWQLLHKSSVFPALGLGKLRKLAKLNNVELYLITGRFAELKDDYDFWLKKIGAKQIFKATYINDKNEQPHLFKEKMIKKLNLDHFVEDNWDIVEHLKNNTQARIFWIFNLFDRNKKHEDKHPGLMSVADALEKIIHNSHKK